MKSTSLILVLALCSVLLSCGPKKSDNPQGQLDDLRAQRSKLDAQIKELESKVVAKNGGTLTPVTVVSVQETRLPHEVEVKGTIDSKSTVNISAIMGGRITRVNVSSGQAVAAGQILIELDNEVIKKGMEELKVQIDFARIVFEKQKRVFDQKAGSEIQYLTAKNQLEALQQRMESLKEQLQLTRITAPRSGFCDNVTAKVGEMAAPGMPLLTLVNMSDVRVIVDVSEAFLSTINNGDAATITFGDSNDTIRTTIRSVSRVVNPMNRTFRLELPLSKVTSTVRPNATCRVAINDVTIEKGLAVPLSSVQSDAHGTYVLCVDKTNKVYRVEIKPGITAGPMMQVLSGLAIGDRVINKGVTTVADGQSVKVVN